MRRCRNLGRRGIPLGSAFRNAASFASLLSMFFLRRALNRASLSAFDILFFLAPRPLSPLLETLAGVDTVDETGVGSDWGAVGSDVFDFDCFSFGLEDGSADGRMRAET